MPALVGPDGHQKPHWSYAALIGQAIFSTETLKMSLAEVYAYIMASYPYYKKEDSGWQNSIRHNLSLNECFVKTARGPDNPGKGCLWAIAPGCEDQFADGNFVK
ncbi:fork head domain-domain-containing protein, partial [Leucosporidium creatinivorum]